MNGPNKPENYINISYPIYGPMEQMEELKEKENNKKISYEYIENKYF